MANRRSRTSFENVRKNPTSQTKVLINVWKTWIQNELTYPQKLVISIYCLLLTIAISLKYGEIDRKEKEGNFIGY
jgi:hypothetical protein